MHIRLLKQVASLAKISARFCLSPRSFRRQPLLLALHIWFIDFFRVKSLYVTDGRTDGRTKPECSLC